MLQSGRIHRAGLCAGHCVRLQRAREIFGERALLAPLLRRRAREAAAILAADETMESRRSDTVDEAAGARLTIAENALPLYRHPRQKRQRLSVLVGNGVACSAELPQRTADVARRKTLRHEARMGAPEEGSLSERASLAPLPQLGHFTLRTVHACTRMDAPHTSPLPPRNGLYRPAMRAFTETCFTYQKRLNGCARCALTIPMGRARCARRCRYGRVAP